MPCFRYSRATVLLCVLLAGAVSGVAQQTSENNERLAKLLEQQPEADTNRDGVLTVKEARAWQREEAIRTGPQPTHADIAYGPHALNVFDFWQAPSSEPAPLVVFIHGGGFVGGDKSKARGDALLPKFLAAGVSFASINYRFRRQTPIQNILRDAARAIQYMRYHARRFNIDKTRVGAYGGSAGAGTSLWLAVHDDLADPGNPDPVLRESSRLAAAGSQSGQFSYDITLWEDVFGIPIDKFHPADPSFFGFKSVDEYDTEKGKRIRADVDMRGLISPDDAPVFLISTQPGGTPTSKGHLNHHPKHSIVIKERLDAAGVPSQMYLPALGKPPPDSEALLRFFLKHLKNE